MARRILLCLIAPVLIQAGCSYQLSLEGKRCDPRDAPCPPGYRCEDQDGQSVCLREDQTGDCTDSQECAAGEWCNPDNSRCEVKGDCQNPGQPRCSAALDQVLLCSAESGHDDVTAACTAAEYCDPYQPECLPLCSGDSECQSRPGTSCQLSLHRCVPIGTCPDQASCQEGASCIESAVCVPDPLAAALDSSGGPAQLGCYSSEPAPPAASPASCDLQGRVVNFLSRQELADAVGLTIRIHRRADVLAGMLDHALAETTAFDDGGVGQYSLSDLPTNTPLVLEVVGRPESADPPAFAFATMYTFGVYLRADDCSTGVLDLAAPSIYQTNYNGYSNPPGQIADSSMGLLLGVVRDCAGSKVANATIGTTIPYDTGYFIGLGGQPDMSATATSATGFYVFANAEPLRGLVNALARKETQAISLWTRSVRVFPRAASLASFEPPQAPRD